MSVISNRSSIPSAGKRQEFVSRSPASVIKTEFPFSLLCGNEVYTCPPQSCQGTPSGSCRLQRSQSSRLTCRSRSGPSGVGRKGLVLVMQASPWKWEYCSPATLPSVSYPDLHALPAKERLVILMNFLANASRINLKLLYTYQASMPKPTSPAVEYL